MKSLSEYPDVLIVEEMSEILGISTKTAYRLLREGKIKHIRLGRLYRILKKSLIEYINTPI